MNEQLFQIMVVVLFPAFGFVLALLFKMQMKHREDTHIMDIRLAHMETLMQFLSGEKAMKLHSPHTPQLDVLLEKYHAAGDSLSPEEWEEMRRLCNEVIADKTATGEKLGFAKWMLSVANHELEMTQIVKRKL